MKLGIEILTGRFFYIEIGDEATVESLKKEIARKEEEEVEESRLLLMHSSGRLLKDDNTALAKYGCRDGSILYLFFCPPGASPWPNLFEDRMALHVKEG
ncbi:hypothetical protein Cni_G08447 [Canna indica]|uniref:Ubiquitin-like domain-containing protein n=1 Tax=Canna indica TaxID=4628 RepID=A0AAQ3Q5R9_9LILI|nr:hypothetical protein Cni_G08447 [Canna indica]